MPSQTIQKGPLKIYNTTVWTGPPSSTTQTENDTPYFNYVSSVSKQNVSRRVRPTDLFASGTPLVHSENISTMTMGSQTTRSPAVTTTVTAPCAHWIAAGAPSTTLSIDENKLSGRLRGQIKSMNLNLAQSMAEYKQTSRMFASLANDVFRTFRSFRNGRAHADFIRSLQRPVSRNERDTANRWLQYQYGLKPLMSDIYGLSDVMSQKIRTGFYRYVRASTTETRREGGTILPVGHARFWDHETTLRGVARYKVSDASLKTLTQCGITNPLLLAWELVPYSFVVDWLFPVGNYLSSLDALNGTSDLRVIYSTTQKWTCTATAVYGGTHIVRNRVYARGNPSGILAMPKLGYQPSTSLTAVLNGLALLIQLRKR